MSIMRDRISKTPRFIQYLFHAGLISSDLASQFSPEPLDNGRNDYRAAVLENKVERLLQKSGDSDRAMRIKINRLARKILDLPKVRTPEDWLKYWWDRTMPPKQQEFLQWVRSRYRS
jgi:hypothetical protein